jgi:excisionase family DNA binding protein
MDLDDMPEYMTVKQLAAVLQVPVSTIYQWRYTGDAPPGMRVGGHVRFRREDVRGWLDQCADAAV